jgi:hypothetical protein
MGHAKVDTTLNVYAQVIDGSLRRAADAVGSELFTVVHKPEETCAWTQAEGGRPSGARARDIEPKTATGDVAVDLHHKRLGDRMDRTD